MLQPLLSPIFNLVRLILASFLKLMDFIFTATSKLVKLISILGSGWKLLVKLWYLLIICNCLIM